MKKRIISLCLVVCLLAVSIIGGTMAYFTDTKNVTNTMAIGDVEIEIHEYKIVKENNQYTLKDFVANDLTLYPITQDSTVREANGMLWNKVVRTENKSTAPAYIRTIIAVEHIDSNNEWNSAVALGFSDTTCNYNVQPDKITLNGVTYDVYTCTNKNGAAVEPNATFNSLQSVYLYENVTAAEVAQAGDLEILVVSQGIQTVGLTHDQAMEKLGTAAEALALAYPAENN